MGDVKEGRTEGLPLVQIMGQPRPFFTVIHRKLFCYSNYHKRWTINQAFSTSWWQSCLG